MNETSQKVSTIIEEIKRPKPRASRIVNNLYDLLTKEEYQSFSDSEFYDIVGKTFISNPEYFKKKIYFELKRKFHGKVNRKEMDKYIIENFSLYAGEQILYESEGRITQYNRNNGVRISVDGMLYLTKSRIIARGTFSSSGGDYMPNRKKERTGIIESSADQELPCYGYQFKTKNHTGLNIKKKGGNYGIFINDFKSVDDFTKNFWKFYRSIRITVPYKKEALSLKLNTLFEALCKDKNQILVMIREFHAKEIFTNPQFLEGLRVSEEYKQITDVEYLDIVRETYNLNPEHFMKSIYPEMKSWKLPSFLKIKNELFEILKEEGANIL